MVKRIAVFIGFLVLVSVLGILIPLQSNVNEEIKITANPDALFRRLLQDSAWRRWWPGEANTNDSTYTSGNFRFKKQKIFLNRFNLRITSDSWDINAELILTPISVSESSLKLSTSITLPSNPVKRIKGLFLSTDLKKTFQVILSKLNHQYKTTQSLYGIDIEEAAVMFEFATTTSMTLNHQANVFDVYKLVDEVKHFIQQNDAQEKGFPMLSSDKISDHEYIVHMGIPTDRKLLDNNKMKSKWFLKGGQILKTEVTGGQKVISNAMAQVEQYIRDYHHAPVAIPYQYLITNRLDQTDSSKWITGIYYPVILK